MCKYPNECCMAHTEHDESECHTPDMVESSRSPGCYGAWISVADQKPESGRKVLATFKNSHGKSRRICAHYAARFVIESFDDEEGVYEYSEEHDNFYVREGWYENIENWGDYSFVAVTEGEITHWMPLPGAP